LKGNRYADHLNTPRLVADSTGTTVWRWDQAEPFGDSPGDENPSGLGTFDLPLRLPGQYYDAESGLHYNYFRDYDPSLGIYKQSDPIGVEGGLNTYVYLGSAPITDSDFYGLIKGTTRGFWRVPCPEKERAECDDRCKAKGEVRKSCMVTRGVRWIVQGGTAVQQLYTVPGSMSCECTDCENDGPLKKFWNWLTGPRYKDDDPFAPYSGGGAKPVNPIGPPPPGRWAPGFGLP